MLWLAQSAVKPAVVQQAYLIELIGQGKHKVEMLNGISLVDAVFYPKSLAGRLALGAMAVAATVV
jgi:hypothetical protein